MKNIWVLVPLCIFFFLYCPSCSAGILEDVFGHRYLTSVDDLRYDGVYAPDQVNCSIVHTTNGPQIDAIEGWIDIVGYENMVEMNGIYYINDTVIPIVQYDVWCGPMHWNCYWDEIDVVHTQISTVGNITTAKIDVRLQWHHTSNSGEKSYFVEYATLTDVDTSPQMYTGLDCTNTSIEVVIYNNTITPKTTMKILDVPDNTLSINYVYESETIVHHLGTATQDYTLKNIPYMNISWVDYWEDNGNLSQFNNFVFVPHMNFTEDNMTIIINDPYTSTELNNTTVYELKYHGIDDVYSPLLPVFLLIVGVFVVGSYLQLGRLWY